MYTVPQTTENLFAYPPISSSRTLIRSPRTTEGLPELFRFIMLIEYSIPRRFFCQYENRPHIRFSNSEKMPTSIKLFLKMYKNNMIRISLIGSTETMPNESDLDNRIFTHYYRKKFVWGTINITARKQGIRTVYPVGFNGYSTDIDKIRKVTPCPTIFP